MRRSRLFTGLLLAIAVTSASQSVLAAAPAETPDADYEYRSQPRDTLIGLSRRLLKVPGRWRELSQRNRLANPDRLAIGTVLLIPRDWLRVQPESAAVVAVTGQATVAGRAIKVGDTLDQGAILATASDGYVTLTLADGSTVSVTPNSVLQLQRLHRYEGTGARDTRLNLESGGLGTHVAPQGNTNRFQIRTPVALSAVRGTEFRRAVDDAATLDRTEVIEGSVAVGQTGGGAIVPAGYGTISDPASGPRPPVRLLAPPDLSQLPAQSADSTVAIPFTAVAGARAYRIQLTRDADFRMVVGERVTETPGALFPELADGHYWVRVRSIDAQGLEGSDSTGQFDRHRLLPAPATIEPATGAFITGASATFRWSPVAGAAAYHFQLARDERFADVVTDRTRARSSGELIEGLAPGQYYWRLAAVDDRGDDGRWGTVQSYRQKSLPPSVASPVFTDKQVTFEWPGQPGQRYSVEVARDAGFSRVTDSLEVDAPRAVLPRRGPGAYYVRLKVSDADGYVGPHSPAQKFITPTPRWVWFTPLILLLPLL